MVFDGLQPLKLVTAKNFVEGTWMMESSASKIRNPGWSFPQTACTYFWVLSLELCVCVFFFWVCTWVDKMIYSYFVTWSVLMPHTIRNLWWVASIFVYQMILSDLSQGQVLLSEINFCGLWVHTNPQKKIEIKPFFLWSFSGNLQILCIFPPIFRQGKPFPNKNVSESFFFPFVFFQHVISTNQPCKSKVVNQHNQNWNTHPKHL